MMKNKLVISRTKFYKVWVGIKTRCLNKKSPLYAAYGGSGIDICKDWLSFNSFYNDMYFGYKEGLQIDRINNNLGYFKENYRWVTPSVNTYNRKKPKRKLPTGVYKRFNRYQAKISINNHLYVIGSFESVELARQEYLKVEKEWWGKYFIE